MTVFVNQSNLCFLAEENRTPLSKCWGQDVWGRGGGGGRGDLAGCSDGGLTVSTSLGQRLFLRRARALGCVLGAVTLGTVTGWVLPRGPASPPSACW